MPRKTIKQRKDEIRTWRAFYDGKCSSCGGKIEQMQLVCRAPETDLVIHYRCHPDWRPAPAPGYDYSGRRKKDG